MIPLVRNLLDLSEYIATGLLNEATFILNTHKPVWLLHLHATFTIILLFFFSFFFRFKTGITLRFPRLEAVRNDKMWYECLDLKELTRLKSVRQKLLSFVAC